MKTNLFGSRLYRMAALVLFAVLFLAIQGQAAEFKPTMPIQLVVPFSPGGGSDVFGRTIARIIEREKLSPQPLIVQNAPGGSGTIGTTQVAQAKGNTHMLLTFISGQVTGPLVAGKGAATYKDLTMIGMLAIDEQLIIVKTGSRFKSIKDVVAESKKKENSITIGGTGTVEEDMLCNRLFEKAAGIKLRYVPFSSGGECITALLGGHVDMIWANPGEYMSQYEAKTVRPIVVAKDVRMQELKEVPTFRDEGLDVTFKLFRGIAAPGGIPLEVVVYYENMMKKLAESKAWNENYVTKYQLSPSWQNSKEFSKTVTDSEVVYGGILKELNLIK